MMTNRRQLTPAVVLVAVLAGFASSAFAQTVTPGANGAVSVSAAGAPLSAVLDEIGKVAPFDALTVAASAQAKPVTIELQNEPVRSALIAVLEAAGVNYGLTTSPADGRLRLAVIASNPVEAIVVPAAPIEQPAATVDEASVQAIAESDPDVLVSPNPLNVYSRIRKFVPGQLVDTPAWETTPTDAQGSTADAPPVAGNVTPAGLEPVAPLPAVATAGTLTATARPPVKKVGG